MSRRIEICDNAAAQFGERYCPLKNDQNLRLFYFFIRDINVQIEIDNLRIRKHLFEIL